MDLAQLAVFVRPPIAGSAKTRLSGLFGEQGAAEVYEAFVEDTLRLCARIRAAGRIDVALWCAGSPNDTVVRWASRMGTIPRVQPDGDLGARLGAAFETGLAQFERVVIIGSDAPTLPIDLIVDAFDSLAWAQMVLGPTRDGGFYAIGASRSTQLSFEGVRWSASETFEDTLEANRKLRVAITPPWYDVDEPEDVQLLRAHLSVDSAIAPATAQYLAQTLRVTDRA